MNSKNCWDYKNSDLWGRMMSIRLGNICKFQSGGTPAKGKSKYYKGNIPWITTTALNGGNIGLNEAVDLINENAIKESAAKIVPARSIMVGTRVGIGKVAINAVEMSTNQDIVSLLDIDENIWNKNFLCKFLQSKSAFLNSQARGATIKGIKINILSELELPEIPIKEQNYISWVIDKVKMILDARQQQLQKLDELIKARFIELFGDPMTDTSKWSVSTIGDQFDVTSGGTPATGEKVYWDNGTIPWIGSNMCQDTILCENDGKFITEEGYAHSSAKWFYKGTVLVALVGATIGKTALLRFDTTTNQNIAAIDVNGNAAFSSEFVFYHMQMLYTKFMEIGSGKFKMANQGFIRQLPLICPPLELQEQFAAFVEQTDKTKIVRLYISDGKF